MVDERGRFADPHYTPEQRDRNGAYVVTIVFVSMFVAFITGYGCGMTRAVVLDCPSPEPSAAYESVSP